MSDSIVEKLRKFADIIENSIDRQLTKKEYQYIKSLVLYDDVVEFWESHLTKSGYDEYRKSASQGCHGKWKVYEAIYKKVNTKLYKALR